MLYILFHLIDSKLGRALLANTWALLIIYLCLMPQSQLPHWSIPGLDKFVHILLFALFMFFLSLVLKNKAYQYSIAFLSTLALGLAIEAAQQSLPQLHRCFEWADIGADALGALIGGALHVALASFRKKRMHS
jgi:VanZ family protein